jgi:hypothetical protein
MSDDLSFLASDAVRAVWEKALARRHTDPEGAIVSALTLLDRVCKHILDGMNVPYSESADLAAVMKVTLDQLSLAPGQQSEKEFRRILDGAAHVMEGLCSLRDRFGAAHERRSAPGAPSPRHAQLAVNMAGAVATFLVETWEVQLEELLEDLQDSKGG